MLSVCLTSLLDEDGLHPRQQRLMDITRCSQSTRSMAYEQYKPYTTTCSKGKPQVQKRVYVDLAMPHLFNT